MKSARGFTLIELLLYVSILGTLLTAVVLFFNLANEAQIKNMAINEVNEQGTFIMDYMTQAVRNSSAISSPAAAVSGTSLSLAVPTASQSPTTFSVIGGNISVTKGTGSAIVLDGSNVTASNLTVTNATRSGTNGVVRISFTLTYLNNTGRNEYAYSRTFTSAAEVSW